MAVYHAGGQTGSVRRVSRRKVRHLDSAPVEASLSGKKRSDLIRSTFDAFVLEQGLDALREFMEEEVNDLVGQKGKHRADRTTWRHGFEQGWIALMGRKVHITRPRVRSKDGHEIVLETYVWAQNQDGLIEAEMRRVLNGVSTRRLATSLDAAEEVPGYGVSRSRISERFGRYAQQQLEKRLAERLETLRFVVLMIDGVKVGDHTVIVALGIDADGHKRLVGLREGATENATVTKELLEDLVQRGLKYEEGLLIVIDGSKALRSAVGAVFGNKAVVQRCQVHKKRNVLDHLPNSEQKAVARELRQAYLESDYETAKKRLERLADRLEPNYPGAARSLREGMEETLTVHRLGLPGALRVSLATTNPIESPFSTFSAQAKRVKKWGSGRQVDRWVAVAFLTAEKGFRRIRGYLLMAVLQDALRKEVGHGNPGREESIQTA